MYNVHTQNYFSIFLETDYSYLGPEKKKKILSKYRFLCSKVTVFCMYVGLPIFPSQLSFSC